MPQVEVSGCSIEYQWYRAPHPGQREPLVMLHEGLGSVSLWKDFPDRVAHVTGRNVLAYSRQGYGQSSALSAGREPDYMHDEALKVLPQLREKLGIGSCALLGHSDGASIALIHAGARRWPVSSLTVIAPHVFVEDISVQSITSARQAYLTTDLRERLARHHADPDGAFRGWCDIWLDDRFRHWNIEEYLPGIECPVLAIQGHDDEYGSLEQVHRILRAVELIEVMKLESCGHWPHRDQPDKVLSALRAFLEACP